MRFRKYFSLGLSLIITAVELLSIEKKSSTFSPLIGKSIETFTIPLATFNYGISKFKCFHECGILTYCKYVDIKDDFCRLYATIKEAERYPKGVFYMKKFIGDFKLNIDCTSIFSF
ncbi:unnamed protein product [Brachionus calyciflorus]|uniref:Apple domain-containing protein n=1 Tax=Brachionus calyciflorus TaxID=104777 RepID=A0A814J6L0_9BILA|nr:unnamed protein product [Brachionus calyciflorus]